MNSEYNRVVHVIGNGDLACLYKPQKGIKLICNLPPFEIPASDVYATCMVDFKMMAALTEGSLQLGMYDWVLGTRPRKWMEMRPDFYMKWAPRIKGFYQHVPEYCGPVGSALAATNFNCGHMAVHYACNQLKATEVHMYGFDTIFDFNMRSVTDLYLNSDRSNTNNYKLINNWRPIWTHMWNEFPHIKFVLYHNHNDIKIPYSKNVSIDTRQPT